VPVLQGIRQLLGHYEILNNPNLIGRETKRWYTFQGSNRMSLRIDSDQPGVDTTLNWERVVRLPDGFLW